MNYLIWFGFIIDRDRFDHFVKFNVGSLCLIIYLFKCFSIRRFNTSMAENLDDNKGSHPLLLLLSHWPLLNIVWFSHHIFSYALFFLVLAKEMLFYSICDCFYGLNGSKVYHGGSSLFWNVIEIHIISCCFVMHFILNDTCQNGFTS